MQQVMLQTTIPQQPFDIKTQEQYEQQSMINALSQPIRQFLSIKPPSKCLQSQHFHPNQQQSLFLMLSHEQDDNKIEAVWPQISAIVHKIKILQSKLQQSLTANGSLANTIKQLKKQVTIQKQSKKNVQDMLNESEQKFRQLDGRIKELEDALYEKQKQLSEKQTLLQQIQFGQLKKKSEYEQKLRKGVTENKQVMEKLRKANLELQKERKSCRDLRDLMNSRIQQMQSQRQQYLIQQISKLKSIIAESREERETKLYQEIDLMRRKIYSLEQQNKRRNIELSLAERKKLQALNQVLQKKEIDMKVQKSLVKSLNDKLARATDQLKNARVGELLRNRHGNKIQKQDEMQFQLSPDKD